MSQDGRRLPDGPGLLTSKLRRRINVTALSMRSTARALITHVRVQLAPTDRKKEIVAAAQLKTAEDVARELGNMKGAIMKLGQMASYVATNLSEDVRAPLTSLQQSAPPMSWELVEEQLHAELGAPPQKVFEWIDRSPAAAASIGQVHRGVLDDGRQVAVKVQYPGVDKAIEADLENAWILKMLIGRAFPGVDPDTIFEEFRARLTEELDYRREAANHRFLEEAWRDDPVVVIPFPIEELTTKRVLVTEWYEGRKFDKVLRAPQKERDRIGAEIYRFAQTCIGTLRFFSGDPHPGNYIFLRDGRIAFLDFGMMKKLDVETLSAQWRIVEAAREGDSHSMASAMREAGYISSDTGRSEEEALGRFIRALVEPVREDKPYRFTPRSRAEIARLFMAETGEGEGLRKVWSLPRDLVYFNRLNLGLAGVLTALRAENNWFRIFEGAWEPVAKIRSDSEGADR